LFRKVVGHEPLQIYLVGQPGSTTKLNGQTSKPVRFVRAKMAKGRERQRVAWQRKLL
jgi:hypothetical protein